MPTFLQSFIVGIGMSLVEMRSHKLRSVLSTLGVMLGVASLVAMLTLIGGIEVFLSEKIGEWAGSVWLWEKRDGNEDDLSRARSPGLRLSDGPWLEQNSEPVVESFQFIRRRGRAYLAGEDFRLMIMAADSLSLADDFSNLVIDKGRSFTREDFESGRKVCLIPWETEEKILRARTLADRDSIELVGSDLLYQNVRFTVVGIFTPRNEDMVSWRTRRTVFVPIRALQRYITGFDPHPGVIRVRVSDPARLAEQTEQLVRDLTARHRGVEDFEYQGAEFAREIQRMLGNVSLLMSMISVISLLVGGMSIMNVMLSSIAERLHEIGLRKALGARNGQIFIQFIAETTTLSVAGGSIGAILGSLPLLFKEAIRKSTQGAIEPTILPAHALLVLGVVCAVGILFGMYPALRASRMNPIEALRYE
jgi:putative ABC transport system permease protein